VPYRWQYEGKGGVSNCVVLAIFAVIFQFLAHPVATIAKGRPFLDGLYALWFRGFSANIALPFIGDAFVF